MQRRDFAIGRQTRPRRMLNLPLRIGVALAVVLAGGFALARIIHLFPRESAATTDDESALPGVRLAC